MSNQEKWENPPKLATKLLSWFVRDDLAEEVLGDLEEKFHYISRKKSLRRARINYWYEVLHYLRPFAIRKTKIFIHTTMISHYFKISWRSLLANKCYSLINIFGLAFGLASCLLIMLYVVDEMKYDQHHVYSDQIYRVEIAGKTGSWASTSAPVGPGLTSEFPEVSDYARLLKFPGMEKIVLRDTSSQKQFFETNGYYVDSSFFKILTYDFIYGGEKSLMEPNTVVLSENVAYKLFGENDPMDRVISIGLPFGDFKYTVKGVYKDDLKSHIPAHFLLSMNNSDVGDWVNNQTSWMYNNIFHTYLKLESGVDVPAFEQKIKNYIAEKSGQEYVEVGMVKELYLKHVPDIYLHSHAGYEVAANGNVTYLYIFTSIAAFLLLIACINFMNLSTARSEKRAKEVGMRKVIGANKVTLIWQFLSESLLVSGISLMVCVVLVQFALPVFNQWIHKDIALIDTPIMIIWVIGLTLLCGILAGIYPAFYLSSFQPITVLKGKLKNTFSAVFIRRGLVVFQFTISIILILGALLITRQMDYMSNRNLGFDNSQKLVLPLQTIEAVENGEILREELLKEGAIENITIVSTYPGIINIQDMLFFKNREAPGDHIDVELAHIDDQYLNTLNIQLVAGRGFTKEFKADTNSIVLNVAAVKQFGWTPEEALNQNIYFKTIRSSEVMSIRIIGVVEDFHYRSLHEEIGPLGLSISDDFNGTTQYLIASVKSQDYQNLLSRISDNWATLNTKSPFSWSFLDDDFQKNYEREQLTSNLIRFFTLIAIGVACLGLFGLATFMAEQRTKEIGVRKVLGANTSQLVSLLTTDFVKLVLVAILIGSPIAFFAMKEWLSNFAYSIGISWWMFPLAGLSALSIAVFTVSFQAIRSALANPVKSLRSE